MSSGTDMAGSVAGRGRRRRIPSGYGSGGRRLRVRGVRVEPAGAVPRLADTARADEEHVPAHLGCPLAQHTRACRLA